MSATPESVIKKWRILVDRLIHYTDVKKIKWQPSADEDVFITRVGNNQISINQQNNRINWEVMDYVIKIYNEDGDVIDAFSDEDIGAQEYFKKMKELYLSIARITNGTEEILDSILRELPDPDEIPF